MHPPPPRPPSTGVTGQSGRTGATLTPPYQAAAPSPGSLPHGAALYKEARMPLRLQPFRDKNFSPCMSDVLPPALDPESFYDTNPAVMRYPSPAAWPPTDAYE
jgi:hypothetical protein